MIAKLIPLLLVFKTFRCSLVIDSEYHQGLYIEDYCPTDLCKEGVHVMCLYYNNHRKPGPNCINFQNISMTAELAIQALEVINEMRSRIANGQETGKNGEPFPRGYGLFRFKWDSELATFAQVVCDLCHTARMPCKASRRFPRPGVFSYYSYFSHPYWEKYRGKDTSKILTTEILINTITDDLKTIYKTKATLTKDHIQGKSSPGDSASNYIPIINGRGTHIGCGISAYVRLNLINGKLQNAIHFTCYLSTGTNPKNESVYETQRPPAGRGYSRRCGCPPGALEDKDCLCNQVPIRDICSFGESSEKCDPTLVLLPIFTLEDAPPEKLYQMPEEKNDPIKNFVLQRIENSSKPKVIKKHKLWTKEQQSTKVLNLKKDQKKDIQHSARKSMSNQTRGTSHKTEKKTSPTLQLHQASKTTPRPPRRPSKPPRLSSHHSLPPPPPLPPRIPPPVDHYTRALKTHEEPTSETCDGGPSCSPRKRRPTKKFSIFTNVTQWDWAEKRRKMTPPLAIIKEVERRKKKDNSHKAVNEYVKHTHREDTAEADLVVTETGLHKAEDVVIDFNEYLKSKNYSNYNHKNDDIKDDSDNELLSLLDALEQKVKHITLDDKEKEILDIKLRKIYGTAIGKTTNSIFSKPYLIKTADLGDAEIEFDDTDVSLKHTKHHEIDKHMRGLRGYDYLTHKRINKLPDSYDMDKLTKAYNHIHNDDEHSYDDIANQYINDLYRKHRKKTVNNLDHEHNVVEPKFRRYLPASRMKTVEVIKAIFKKFENENSQEDASKLVDYHKNSETDRKKLITNDIKKRKISRRRHRSNVKSSNSHNDVVGDLGLERRKYYQDKLDKVKKMLRSYKNSRRNSWDDRSTRRKQKKMSIFA